MNTLMLILAVLFLFFFAVALLATLALATAPLLAAVLFGGLAFLCLIYREKKL